MSIQQFIPQLRFPEFVGEWEEKKLGEISEKITEKNIDNQYKETFTNSAEHGIISQRSFFDKDIANEEKLNNYYIVRQNYFVYNPRISNFAPVGPIKRNKLGRVGVMSPLYYVFKTVNVDVAFLEYYFETSYWHKFMKLNGDSGARADRFAIKNATFKTMPLPYPKQVEQHKIGDFLRKIDHEIDLAQRTLDLLDQQKKGYMQRIFSQELSFKDDEGNDYPEWEIGKLYSIANIKKGEQIKKEAMDSKGKYYYLNGGMSASGRTNIFNTKPITISISEGGNSCGYVKMNKEYFFSGGHNYTLQNLSINSFYLFAYLKFNEKKIMALRVGSGLPNIQKRDISIFTIKIPHKEEQQKIGKFFSKFDDLIEQQTCKIKLLKQRKSALLQQMFI